MAHVALTVEVWGKDRQIDKQIERCTHATEEYIKSPEN